MAELFKLQREFSQRIRTPEKYPQDTWVEPRRMKIYQELFYNNIKSFLDNGFPVLSQCLGEGKWSALVRDFIREHHCESPHFIHIAGEFVTYLAESHDGNELPEYATELAHYEWQELEISVRKGEAHIESGTLQLSDSVWLSPLANLLQYTYPVHVISPENQADIQPQQTQILIFRDESDEVQFVVVSPLSMLLLHLIHQSPGIQLSQLIEQVQGYVDSDAIADRALFEQQCIEAVQGFFTQTVIQRIRPQ